MADFKPIELEQALEVKSFLRQKRDQQLQMDHRLQEQCRASLASHGHTNIGLGRKFKFMDDGSVVEVCDQVNIC